MTRDAKLAVERLREIANELDAHADLAVNESGGHGDGEPWLTMADHIRKQCDELERSE
jgi:hypothetical protein